ncbi:MAG: viperin family antiviral radical SAM protein [Malacoplasma sp.]|nr:viperin family antiviral radical SAM protein [Malacoplasma sp.]
MKKLKINFHVFEMCNMRCSYCFRDKKCDNFSIRNISEYKKIIEKLKELNLFNEINFAGGEPTIMKNLPDLLRFSKENNFENSIITNGYIISENEIYLEKILKDINTLGISIDSLDENINKQIGRFVKKESNLEFLTIEKIKTIYKKIKKSNQPVKLKINTVCSCFNKEDNSLIQILKNNIIVDRWKFLSVHTNKSEIKNKNFNLFIENFKKYEPTNIKEIVVEKDGSMARSYIMINGLGDISCYATNNIKVNVFTNTKEEIEKYLKENLDNQNYFSRYRKEKNDNENTIHM